MPAADKDDLIVAALACGKTWREAAAAASVAESTVGVRMKDPAFRQRVEELRARIIGQKGGEIKEDRTPYVPVSPAPPDSP